MHIGLAGMLEVVLVLASGMAMARWAVLGWTGRAHPWTRFGWRDFAIVTEPFLAGVALAGGLGLGWEAIRGRTHRTWGLGRWMWAVSALTVLFHLLDVGTLNPCYIWWLKGAWPGFAAFLDWAQNAVLSTFSTTGWALGAVGLTWRLAGGGPGEPVTDAREWAGRFLLVAILLEVLAHLGISLLGH